MSQEIDLVTLCHSMSLVVTLTKDCAPPLITSNSAFSPTSGEPKWQEAVKIWNATSDQTAGIYYKVCNESLCLINYLK